MSEHDAGYLSAVRSGVAATGSGKAEQLKSASKLTTELEPNGSSGQNDECQVAENMVARDGVEPPQAFQGCILRSQPAAVEGDPKL